MKNRFEEQDSGSLRRDFIKNAAVGVFGLSLAPNFVFGQQNTNSKVRLGFIGVGGRGRSHLRNILRRILRREDVLIPAICDIDPAAVEQTLDMISKAGYEKPAIYAENENSFRDLLSRDDIDGVIIATPWLWHTPMAVAAMEAGYAGRMLGSGKCFRKNRSTCHDPGKCMLPERCYGRT